MNDAPTAPAGLISGRYRLGALLGTGGSASVFAAIDTRSGEQIALKILHPALSVTPRLREAFFREARAAARVRHANIVAVLDVGVHDEGTEPLAWIALELAPGQTLAEHVEGSGALSVADALTVALGVLRGLGAAHAAGLIHRDVSPANIMIDPAADGFLAIGSVRLLDFGLADAAGRAATGSDVLRSETAAGQPPPGADAVGVLGSVHYMSPEQAAGVPVDERADIYQLGGVLYFALTASAPFPRDSAAAVMRAHALTPPPVPSVVRPGIPRGVDRLVVRALLKDKQDRFASAEEMRQAILALEPAEDSAPADDHTRRFAAAAWVPVPPADDGRTVVLARGAHQPPAHQPAARRPVPARPASPARGRGGGWVALALVVMVIAAGWVAAAGDSGRSSVAVSSVPPPSATPAAELSTQTAAPVEVVSTSVRVPELTAMTLVEARSALDAAGLRLGALHTQESVRAGDTVLALDPAPGSWLEPGDAVGLTVASGSNGVPATTGLGQAEAVALLQNAGFVAAVVVRADAAQAPGAVLTSQPAETTVLRLGTTVTLTVAGAPAAQTPSPLPTPAGTPVSTSTAIPAP